MNVEAKLKQANGRLKSGRVGVTILQRGNRLYLRTTLPPRPGSTKDYPHQQEISLGIHANAQGIKLAEKHARKVGALLDCKEFTWTPYLNTQTPTSTPATVGDWIKRFEEDYFTRRPTNPKTRTTWDRDYSDVFRKLPPDKPLSDPVILSAITSTTPDTRTRKRYCIALSALARFADVPFDAKLYAGSYKPGRVYHRDIPNDDEIVAVYNQIEDEAWKWAFGILATYGLRPHELFYLDLDDLPILNITGGKTGARRVWPFLPSWVDMFNLRGTKELSFGVTPTNNRHAGQLVGEKLKRLGVPFKSYNLRHAWAIRTLMLGLPVSLAAAQQGHSVAVHTDTYHAYLTEKHHQNAFDLIRSQSLGTF